MSPELGQCLAPRHPVTDPGTDSARMRLDATHRDDHGDGQYTRTHRHLVATGRIAIESVKSTEQSQPLLLPTSAGPWSHCEEYVVPCASRTSEPGQRSWREWRTTSEDGASTTNTSSNSGGRGGCRRPRCCTPAVIRISSASTVVAELGTARRSTEQ